jgi:phosphomannomutase
MGIKLLPKALKEWGFHNLNLVDAQIIPDGNFPTLQTAPNPEEKGVLKLGLEQLERSGSALLLATDPDADRLAVAVMHKGKPYLLNGNQTAAICVEYLCRTLTTQGKLFPTSAIITTIVSTQMLELIAAHYKIAYFEVLTGFKYIGALIHQWEEGNEPYRFLFGAEESYGYLLGTYARDKDAMIIACLVCEIALLMKAEGCTLVDFLQEIFQKYGTFLERQKTIDFTSDEAGIEKCREQMVALRQIPPQTIAGQKVRQQIDYLQGRGTLPKSDVLQFILEDQSKVTVRPSGTEPKLKIYAGVCGQTIEECEQKIGAILCALP